MISNYTRHSIDTILLSANFIYMYMLDEECNIVIKYLLYLLFSLQLDIMYNIQAQTSH